MIYYELFYVDNGLLIIFLFRVDDATELSSLILYYFLLFLPFSFFERFLLLELDQLLPERLCFLDIILIKIKYFLGNKNNI